MARTHGRIKVEVWDVGSDYRQLSIEAQWAYQMLVSQPGVTMCGTLPFAPKKWAKLAVGLSVERLEGVIAELEQGWYVIVDRDTDELLVRTFVKHDEPWRLHNLVVAARRQFQGIESEVIRDYLARRHEWMVDDSMDAEAVKKYEERRASERASERTLPMPIANVHSDDHPDRARVGARVRAQPSPSPTPSPSPEEQKDLALQAERSGTPANGLPFEKERLTIELLAAIGSAGDEGTPQVVRRYAAQLPEGALAKVLESVRGSKAKDRARYVVGALKGELEQLAPRSPSARLRDDPEAWVRQVGCAMPPDVFEEALGELVPSDEDERIRLADLAADLRSAATA